MTKETAMKILKELHNKSLFAERTALETIIPELKESEDEKIRKALVRFHKSTIDIDGIKGADILAWLEKQGGNPAPININKMVMEYSQTKDGDFGLPVNCQIRAYRQGLTDAISTLNLEKQGEQKPFDYESANIQQKDFAPKQEWSDEDEAYKLFAISAVEYYYDEENPLQKAIVNWLKSLKDRMKGKEI